MDRIQSVLFKVAIDVLPVAHAKITAAIVYKGTIVSIGHNSYKTHPFQKRYGRNPLSTHLHAEIDAIIKARRRGVDLRECVLYVMRVKRYNGEWTTGLAKPCDGCARAIDEYQIGEVVYSEEK